MGIAYITKTKMKLEKRIRRHELFAHETKRDNLIKFLFLLSFLVVYFLFVQNEYGTENSIIITALTWSFFVLCTPIADAGFLLDFPIRIATRIRMFYTELIVWATAVLMNVYAHFMNPGVYEKTFLLGLLHHIIMNPYPFWGIIGLCAVGTFLSVYIGDELMDVVSYHERKKHRHKIKYEIILFIFIIVVVVALYDFLLKELGIDIPL